MGEARSLDVALARGVAWTGIVKVLGQTASWLSTLVVARLLVPADYAVVGMAAWLIGLIGLLTEFGLGAAVVAKQRTDPDELRQLNTVAVLSGVAGSTVIALTAPLVAAFFRDPRLTAVAIALGFSFTISALRVVPLAVLQRDLRFARLAQYDGLQSVLLAALSVTLAWQGFGYWTLVAANLVSALVGTGLALARHPIGFAWPRRARLAGTLTFSADVVAQRVCWYAYNNSDFLIVGRVLGSTQAGLYGFVWGLARLVVDRVAAVVFQVTPGVLARAQHDPALLRRYFTGIVAVLAAACLPLMIGLALVAPDFVALVLPPKWAGAATPLRILSAYSSVWVVLGLAGQMLLVVGLERFGTRLNVVQLLVLPPAFWLAARSGGGIVAVALVWLVVHPLFAAVMVAHVLRAIALPWRTFARDALLAPVAGVAAMAAAVPLAGAGVDALHGGLAVRFAAGVAAGGLAYAGTLWFGFRGHVRAAIAAARSLRGGAPAASAV